MSLYTCHISYLLHFFCNGNCIGTEFAHGYSLHWSHSQKKCKFDRDTKSIYWNHISFDYINRSESKRTDIKYFMLCWQKYLSPCVPLESKLEIYSCNFLLDASRQHLPIMEENNDVTNIDKYLGHNNSPGRGSKFGTSTRTDTRKSQEDEELKFPPLKCSKYTWIGHPSMQKRRK